MSLAGAGMILVIALVRAAALHRLPKGIFVALWALAALRLLVPGFAPVRVEVPCAVPDVIVESVEAYAAYPLDRVAAQADGIPTQAAVQLAEQALALDLAALIRWVYAIGAGVTALWYLGAYLGLHRRYAGAKVLENPFLNQWKKEHPLRRTVVFKGSKDVKSPLTNGILHPVILLPVDMDWESDRARQANAFMLEHEWVHIRRMDVLWKLVMNVILCLHWFNPCVWLMIRLFNRDLELSCDEAVLRRSSPNDRAEYARTLILMGERNLSPAGCENYFSQNPMEERIFAIMKKRNWTIGAIALSVLLIAAAAVGFVSFKPEAASAQPDPTAAVDGMEKITTHLLPQDYEKDWNSMEGTWTPRKQVMMTLEDAILQNGHLAMADVELGTSENIVPKLYGLDRQQLAITGPYWYNDVYHVAGPRLSIRFEEVSELNFMPRYQFENGELVKASYSFPMDGLTVNVQRVDPETFMTSLEETVKALYALPALKADRNMEEVLEEIREEGYDKIPGDPYGCDGLVRFTSAEPNGVEMQLLWHNQMREKDGEDVFYSEISIVMYNVE